MYVVRFQWTLNVTQEEQRVDIEEMRDSLRVAVAQYAQAIPALAAQGQDPSEIINRIATVIQGRQKGQALENIIEKAFTPEPAPTPEMPPMAPGMEQQTSSSRCGPRICLAATSTRTSWYGPCCWSTSRYSPTTSRHHRRSINEGGVNMNKGSRATAPMSKPVEGKKDTSKPAGGKVMPSMMPAGSRGNAVKKGIIL
jgi:hypothetical protein